MNGCGVNSVGIQPRVEHRERKQPERSNVGQHLRLGGDGFPRVVDLDVLVVVGLVAGRLAADVAGEGARARVHLHVLGQVVAAVEGLAALGHLARVLLGHLVLAHVALAVVLADELAAAVVACVGPHGLVRVHVRDVLRVADEGALAQRALVGLGGARRVRPAVQLEVPLGGEGLVADDAHVGPLTAVCQQVRA